jgi:hypothetical protein
MKTIISIIFFASIGTVSIAQDTAYISRDKLTALIFGSPVKIIGKIPENLDANNLGNGIITLKAERTTFDDASITTQDLKSKQLVTVPVKYSFGRAGGRIAIGGPKTTFRVIRTISAGYKSIGDELLKGKRSDVVDRKKEGGVKAWVNKLSLADNRIFFRLDVHNKSNLPYTIDFIRFYVRDLKTVARMATHEQEIVPVYKTLKRRITISNKKTIAQVFGFKRFALSDEQAVNVEIYERNGNRHIYLKIKQKNFNNANPIAMPRVASETVAFNHIN